MSQNSTSRRSSVVLLLAAVVVIGGGAILWKLSGSRGRPGAINEQEVERRRVSAVDPAFDPAVPAGAFAGLVKDSEGRAVGGAVVAVTRQRGRDELPTFSQPKPRITVTGADGRFHLGDVLPGDYGVTATAEAGAPARQNKVAVVSGKTSEVTLTLGKGGFLFSGEVNDVGGGPIGRAKVLIRAVGFFTRPGDEPPVFQVVANDNGIFRVRLAAGDYDVTVKAEGYSPARDRATLSAEQNRRYRLNPAARLSGRVLDRQSREPVSGASVWLRLDRLESYVDREVVSDNEGRFDFDDLAAGGYMVMARADKRIGLTRAVSLGVAQTIGDVEVLVERGRAIRGVVVGEGGHPLPDVRVAAGRADPPFERPAFVKTTQDGAFVIAGLLPAKYRVSAWAEGQGASKSETTEVTNRDVEGLRLVMAAALVIRGQVIDSNGRPVAEAAVTGSVESATPERRFMADRARTDAAGNFELTRLGPGKLSLTARHSELGNARRGPEDAESVAKGSAVTLRLETGASVSGVVKFEDGSPAAGVIVWAQATQFTGPVFGPPDQASTDQAGRYRLGGLDKGKYLVMARRGNAFNVMPPAAGRQEVTVEIGEQKSGVDLLLPPGGKRISGKVVAPDGQPVSGAVVSLGFERLGVAFRQPIREGGSSGGHSVSDPDGAFTFDDLQDGMYTLWAADATHADGEQKGVAAGASNVTLRLQSGASVSGVVRTKAGQAVTDYTIVALPAGAPASSPNDRMRMQMTARLWSPSAQVHDPEGSFYIGRLAPGAYELTVTTPDAQGATLPITVGAGDKKEGLILTVDAGAKLIGRVLDLDSGTPVVGAQVQLMSTTRRLEAQTGSDGSFSITGLPPGKSRVDIRPPGTSTDETHIAEHTEIDARPGVSEVDVGVIKLMKGSYREKFAGQPTTRGLIGFTPALLGGRPSVTGVKPGLPADKAGLKDGELLLKIDGRSTQGLGNGALDFLGAGKLGVPLVVTVQSREGGSPRDVTIERAPTDFDPARGGSGAPARTATASVPAARPAPPPPAR